LYGQRTGAKMDQSHLESPTMSNAGTRKDERLDLRLSAQAKALLQRAASARHKTVSEFVVDSSLTAAAETMAERREILLDDAQWEAFLAALDRPPSPKLGLDDLLRRKSVFE
jgi:uncharacterized protein (DUF1778 family)